MGERLLPELPAGLLVGFRRQAETPGAARIPNLLGGPANGGRASSG